MIAALKGARESVKCLLKVGADPDIISKDPDTIALQLAFESRDLDTIEMLCDAASLIVSNT